MFEPGQFADKVVVLVGAASGMGRASAETFAKAGATIVAGDVNPAVDEVFAGLQSEHGVKGFSTRIDVTDFASCTAAVERTLAEFGRIDVLAVFAGVIQEAHDVESLPIEEWDRVMNINLRGHFLMTKAAVGAFKEQRAGRIILITSIWGHEGFDLFSAYCASKGGLRLFTHALAKELVIYGVNVNAIAPGIIDTELHRKALQDEATARDVPLEEIRDKEWGKIPTGRAGSPQDIANAVLFLSANESSYIVGATIDVNGLILVH
jgi:NAD(P)-dependent dehydrogenase (short-subunit alcohol dehydrogenase family)